MRSYEEYAGKPRARMSPASKELLDAFGAVYAVGSACARARKERGLTQCELATLSGVAQAEISRIENCAILPTTQTLLRITSALNMRINFELLATPTRRATKKQLVALTRADGSTVA